MKLVVLGLMLALTALLAPTLAQDEGDYLLEDQAADYQPKKSSVKCYQCAYSPPRVMEQKVKIPVKDSLGKVIYKTRFVKKKQLGGWDKCEGPFTDKQAMAYGVDIWECDSSCYTRTDSNGNVFRGCHRGEFGVDHKMVGCHVQAGSYYCFCEGDRCNNAAAQPFPPAKGGDYVEQLHKY